MNTPNERTRELSYLEIKEQISQLENQFVELFMDEQSKELLRIVHLQLEVLKAELQRKGHQLY